ncbi:MAG: energy transducer TonB [Bryobacteraceae bacterium]|jgi:TonB family protein
MKRVLVFVFGVCILCSTAFAQAVRLSDAEAKKIVKTRTSPEYPPLAKQMRVTGEVRLDVYLNEDGSLDKIHVVSGNALLAGAAQNAVKQWKFGPPLVDDKPVKAVASYSFSFGM